MALRISCVHTHIIIHIHVYKYVRCFLYVYIYMYIHIYTHINSCMYVDKVADMQMNTHNYLGSRAAHSGDLSPPNKGCTVIITTQNYPTFKLTQNCRCTFRVEVSNCLAPANQLTENYPWKSWPLSRLLIYIFMSPRKHPVCA